MNHATRMESSLDCLHEDEKELVRKRRELQSAFQSEMPVYFFRLTPEEETPLWLNLLLIYRMTQSAVATRAGSTIYRINAMEAGSIVSNLERLRNEEILDASIYHSYQPLWEGGKRIELSRFAVNTGEAPVVRADVRAADPALDEIEEIFNTLHGRNMGQGEIVRLLSHFSPAFLQNASAERLAATLDFYIRVRETDSLLVRATTFHRREEPSVGVNRILLGSSNVPRKGFILKAARVFGRMRLILHRVNVTTVFPPDGSPPAGFSAYYVTDRNGAPLVAGSREFERLISELKTIKWTPDEDRISRLVGTVDEPEKPTADEGHLLRMIASFMHHLFGRPDSVRFSIEGIEETYLERPGLAIKLVEIFHRKLHPWRRNPRDFRRLTEEFRKEVDELSTGIFEEDEGIRRVFHESVRFVEHIRKTNFYMKKRSAIAVLLDPDVLRAAGTNGTFEPLPSHIYFVFGDCFQGYHFSYSDFVRGGLRTLLPASKLKYRYDSQGMLRECCELASTQHLKNKDIPEGGSKGLIIARPGTGKETCQRIFVQELVDLLLSEEVPEKTPEILLAGEPGPHLFLGPDENMGNEMIVWIGEYARRRGLYAGSAFMSGHPTIGINHKRYGVTSLGVHTYLKKCLEYRGIDPVNTAFRVKFSGGPDGDVAGNAMKLLIREFPRTARIVAVIDGTGFGYDPEGFDMAALARLVEEGKGIAAFPPERLQPGGRMLRYSHDPDRPSALIEKKGERLLESPLSSNRANRMYLESWYEVEAEVFLPCGGRPATLNERTWKRYLVGGSLSAPIIVEGANLFINPAARRELERKGTLLIRDSSANKCGVITSSYEVLGLLLLGEDGFEEAMDSLIPELLTLLEERAGMEADWLLKRHRESGGTASVVDLSSEYSLAMRERRTCVEAELDPLYDDLSRLIGEGVEPEKTGSPYRRFACAFRDYIPNALLNRVSVKDAWRRLQPAHRKAIIGVQLALEQLRASLAAGGGAAME